VICGSDGLTLVDPGWKSAATDRALVRLLATLGAVPGDVRQFVVTHAHWDHYTQALDWEERYGAQVFLGRAEEDAAAVALVANHQTASFALGLRARPVARETVVVLGAAGGLGSASTQAAAALGAAVIGVVHRDGAEDFVKGTGPAHAVQLRELRQIRELTAGRGADIIADPIGGDAFDDAVRALAAGGRLLVLGFAAGGIPVLKVNRLLLRNIAVLGAGWGEFLRTDPSSLDLVVDGLTPPVTGRFPLADDRSAVELLEAGGVLGKIVIIP
jgi:NADPH2:quinone reductase